MEKMTQRDYFNEIINLAKANGREDIVAFAEGRIAVLDNKNANRKPTKTQVENEGLKARIAEVLTADKPITATEVLTALNDTTLSNQKVSAMLRQMADSGVVVKTMDKKKALWALA